MCSPKMWQIFEIFQIHPNRPKPNVIRLSLNLQLTTVQENFTHNSLEYPSIVLLPINKYLYLQIGDCFW